MALRLAGVIEFGEILNTRKNSTHGYVILRGSEMPIHIELTGNMAPDLHGKHISFRPNPARREYDEDEQGIDPKMVHPQQVGPTGDMTAARWVKTAECSADELVRRAMAGEMPPLQWKRCLYLEWFSQNGRVVIELPDPILELAVGEDENKETLWEPLPLPPGKPDDPQDADEDDDILDPVDGARNEYELNADQIPRLKPDTLGDSPGDSIDDLEQGGLDAYLQSLSSKADADAGLTAQEFSEEFIREIEIVEGKHDDDADHILTILPSYDPDSMSEYDAECMLKVTLARLALHGVCVHMCEHFDALKTLRLIKDEISISGKIHPEMIGSRWVCNYMTSEHCEICEEETEVSCDIDVSDLPPAVHDDASDPNRKPESDCPF